MRALRLSLVLGSALLLAACGAQQEDAATDPPPDPTPEPTAAAAPPPAAAPQPDFAASDAEAIRGGEIPPRYRGVWDAVSGSCHPSSDLRVEITARRIRFYESVGNVTGIGSRGADPIVALAMEGEGERWSRSLRMTLTGAPPEERLVLADALETPQGDPIPLARCPR